jgi:ribosomal protein L11 methyltransferase
VSGRRAPALDRLTLLVAPAQAEVAAAEAAALLGGGWREEEAPDGRVRLDFWLPPGGADPQPVLEALARLGIAAQAAVAAEDPGWADAMARFHRPVEVAGRLLVRPPWEAPRPGLLDVEVDPGMAFGTAQHATTRACLAMLCEVPAGGPLLDAGCGSGVLAVAARRLGFDPVTAIDHDPLSVAATVANARANGVALTVARRTIGAGRLPAAPVVLANLTATVLRALAGALVAPGPRVVIASGMRPGEVGGVAEAFGPLGLRPARRIVEDDWATIRLERA